MLKYWTLQFSLWICCFFNSCNHYRKIPKEQDNNSMVQTKLCQHWGLCLIVCCLTVKEQSLWHTAHTPGEQPREFPSQAAAPSVQLWWKSFLICWVIKKYVVYSALKAFPGRALEIGNFRDVWELCFSILNSWGHLSEPKEALHF